MTDIKILGNNRYKILNDFNNNLFDEKYISINKQSDIILTVFNNDFSIIFENFFNISPKSILPKSILPKSNNTLQYPLTNHNNNIMSYISIAL